MTNILDSWFLVVTYEFLASKLSSVTLLMMFTLVRLRSLCVKLQPTNDHVDLALRQQDI